MKVEVSLSFTMLNKISKTLLLNILCSRHCIHYLQNVFDSNKSKLLVNTFFGLILYLVLSYIDPKNGVSCFPIKIRGELFEGFRYTKLIIVK